MKNYTVNLFFGYLSNNDISILFHQHNESEPNGRGRAITSCSIFFYHWVVKNQQNWKVYQVNKFDCSGVWGQGDFTASNQIDTTGCLFKLSTATDFTWSSSIKCNLPPIWYIYSSYFNYGSVPNICSTWTPMLFCAVSTVCVEDCSLY